MEQKRWYFKAPIISNDYRKLTTKELTVTCFPDVVLNTHCKVFKASLSLSLQDCWVFGQVVFYQESWWWDLFFSCSTLCWSWISSLFKYQDQEQSRQFSYSGWILICATSLDSPFQPLQVIHGCLHHQQYTISICYKLTDFTGGSN